MLSSSGQKNACARMLLLRLCLFLRGWGALALIIISIYRKWELMILKTQHWVIHHQALREMMIKYILIRATYEMCLLLYLPFPSPCCYTPGRDGTRNAARRPGSGGASPGVWFEEQGGGGMYAYTEGVYPYTEGSLSPIAILPVCASYSKLCFLYRSYLKFIFI